VINKINMKIKTGILVFLVMTMIGCSNPAQKNESSNQLEGRWKMTEHYFDIGDGNGQWWRTDSSKQVTLEITSTQIVRNGKDPVRYKHAAPGSFQQYLTNGDSILVKYSFTGDTLELRPPCIEGCGERYVKLR